MSFTVGLLELLGYIVPGATVAGIATVVFNTHNASAVSAYFSTTFGALWFLLVSYITGHLLTIVSRLLTDARSALIERGVIKRTLPEVRYSFYRRLKKELDRVFGGDVDRQELDLIRGLVAERCPRLSDRIDRYFALGLLTRNMAVACFAAFVMLEWTRHIGWGWLFFGSAVLFAFQHFRFDQTFKDAIFRAGFVAFSLAGPPFDHTPTEHREPHAKPR